MNNGAIDFLPVWGVFVATILLILAGMEVGFRMGRRAGQTTSPDSTAAGAMIGPALGLLAFVLAFTFSMAASRNDTRRVTVLEEVNAIGTAYLRAQLVPEPASGEIRSLLRDYVNTRITAVETQAIAEGIRRSEELHVQLWSRAVAVANANPESEPIALFVDSLNQLIDLHTKRVTAGLRARIPGIIWFVLFTLTGISMAAVGFQAGLTGMRRSFAAGALAFSFALVIMLISELDRPSEGLLTVSQQGMLDLRQSMTEP